MAFEKHTHLISQTSVEANQEGKFALCKRLVSPVQCTNQKHSGNKRCRAFTGGWLPTNGWFVRDVMWDVTIKRNQPSCGKSTTAYIVSVQIRIGTSKMNIGTLDIGNKVHIKHPWCRDNRSAAFATFFFVQIQHQSLHFSTAADRRAAGDLPQLLSSSALSQSFSPSHFQNSGMHWVVPGPQLNSFTRHVLVSARTQRKTHHDDTFSLDPSVALYCIEGL